MYWNFKLKVIDFFVLFSFLLAVTCFKTFRNTRFRFTSQSNLGTRQQKGNVKQHTLPGESLFS